MSVLTPRPPNATPDLPATDGGGPSPEPTAGAATGGARRSPWLRYGVPAAVVAAVGAGAFVLIDRSNDEATDATEPVTLRVVEADQRDLIEFTDLDGTLVYATTPSVSAGAGGTITAVVADGDRATRGDTLFEVNARPVVVFYGEVPLYRPLTEGDEGDDVRLVETNLASLGYHTTTDDDGEEVDTDVTVDGVFDAATTDAVERWQADLGLEETGVIQPGDVVVVGGPSTASTISVEVGDVVQEATPVLTLNVLGSEASFHADHTGEVELQVTSGPVEGGQVLYTVDDRPVTAVVVDPEADDADEIVFDRTMSDGVADGADVEALEAMLLALGYDADGDLDVDQTFDDDTADAVGEWQEDLADEWGGDEVAVDGTVSPDDLIRVNAGTTVDTVTDRSSANTARSSELFVSASNDGRRVIETSIAVVDQEALAEGTEVDVEFPDGATTTGVVTSVATSSTVDPTDPTADPRVAAEITVAEIPASADGFSELDVTVKLVDEIAAGATVVPVSALVATGDGYAVEVVASGGGTVFIAVEPGMFADGFVEVTGIEPGTQVVVP